MRRDRREIGRAFGDSLAAARSEAGTRSGKRLLLSTLAERSGVPLLRLNAYEAGTMLPDLEEFYAIADGLEIHPAELLPVLHRGDGAAEIGDGAAANDNGDEEDDEFEDEYGDGESSEDA